MPATANAVKAAVAEPSAPEGGARPALVPLTTLMIDADIVAHFKASGPGWEERMAEILRKAEV